MPRINIVDYVETPRFGKVKIEKVLKPSEAREQGYTEPTHYDGSYDVRGKHIGTNRMTFAVVYKND